MPTTIVTQNGRETTIGSVSATQTTVTTTANAVSTPSDINVTDVNRASPGVGVPAGGTDGQILRKQSDADYDMGWEDVPYASETEAGVLKARLDGTTLYIRTDGNDA